MHRVGDDFNVKQVFGAGFLHQVNRTAFTWTDLPHSLCWAANKKYFAEAAANKNIKGIIAFPSAITAIDIDKAIIISSQADELFYYVHNQGIHGFICKKESGLGQDKCNSYGRVIARSAQVAASAILGENVWVGENVIIQDRCYIADNTVVEADTIIHPNVTIGTQGFFSKKIHGRKTHIHHFGGVRIGKNCIIHTGSNISRSVNVGESTSLEDNVHVGIHSNIGHDCTIGEGTDVSAKVMIAGRAVIGKNCWIGASVAISNAITVGDRAKVRIGSVVVDNVPEGGDVSGNFAFNHLKNIKNFLKNKK